MTQKKILKEDDEKIRSVFIKAISKLVFYFVSHFSNLFSNLFITP